MRGGSYLPAPKEQILAPPNRPRLAENKRSGSALRSSADAVMTLLQALLNSKGTMAQFDHRELGGAGQWMPGGMTMVGDMFNHGLRRRSTACVPSCHKCWLVNPSCHLPRAFSHSHSVKVAASRRAATTSWIQVRSAYSTRDTGRASGQWWPAELGFPNGTGAQNQIRYAYFNQNHRLAVELNGHVTVYDTLDHQISGVSQQQGRGGSLTLTSQRGTVSVSTLPVVSVDGAQAKTPEPRMAPASEPYRPDSAQETDLFAKIERLADSQERHSLIGRIRSQEGGASLPVVSVNQ